FSYSPPPAMLYSLSLTRRSSDLAPRPHPREPAFEIAAFARQLFTESVHRELIGIRLARAFEGDLEERRVLSAGAQRRFQEVQRQDRKSTRLNSSHVKNSYAVFCL